MSMKLQQCLCFESKYLQQGEEEELKSITNVEELEEIEAPHHSLIIKIISWHLLKSTQKRRESYL
jgi:hypothetical protein